MFIINLTYKARLEIIDKFMTEHIKFLDDKYSKGCFIISGRKNPRIGGIILACVNERQVIENIIKEDPFYINNIADYEIIDFIPTKYHERFAFFIQEKNA